MAKRKKEDPYDLCTCYEPTEPTPEEFIDPGDREPTLADTAFYLTDENGIEYVRVEHEMTKEHYISFLAAVSPDRLQTVKLYPEWDAEARFRIDGVQRIFYYCNRDGLYCLDPIKEIEENI